MTWGTFVHNINLKGLECQPYDCQALGTYLTTQDIPDEPWQTFLSGYNAVNLTDSQFRAQVGDSLAGGKVLRSTYSEQFRPILGGDGNVQGYTDCTDTEFGLILRVGQSSVMADPWRIDTNYSKEVGPSEVTVTYLLHPETIGTPWRLSDNWAINPHPRDALAPIRRKSDDSVAATMQFKFFDDFIETQRTGNTIGFYGKPNGSPDINDFSAEPSRVHIGTATVPSDFWDSWATLTITTRSEIISSPIYNGGTFFCMGFNHYWSVELRSASGYVFSAEKSYGPVYNGSTGFGGAISFYLDTSDAGFRTRAGQYSTVFWGFGFNQCLLGGVWVDNVPANDDLILAVRRNSTDYTPPPWCN